VTPTQKALAEIEAHKRECIVRHEEITRRLDSGSKRFARLELMLWGVYPFIAGSVIAAKFL